MESTVHMEIVNERKKIRPLVEAEILEYTGESEPVIFTGTVIVKHIYTWHEFLVPGAYDDEIYYARLIDDNAVETRQDSVFNL